MNKPRVYGRWAGNPNGRPEDPARCIEEVCGVERGALPHQCGKKRGYGSGGLYCKQHDPDIVKAKDAARTAAYNEKWAKIEMEREVAESRKAVAEGALEEFRLGRLHPGTKLYDAVKKYADLLN